MNNITAHGIKAIKIELLPGGITWNSAINGTLQIRRGASIGAMCGNFGVQTFYSGGTEGVAYPADCGRSE